MSDGDVELTGRFEGVVRAQGIATVAAQAEVRGEIEATAVIVGGRVEGRIQAAARVLILPGGALRGRMTARSVIVAEGGVLMAEARVSSPEKTHALQAGYWTRKLQRGHRRTRAA